MTLTRVDVMTQDAPAQRRTPAPPLTPKQGVEAIDFLKSVEHSEGDFARVFQRIHPMEDACVMAHRRFLSGIDQYRYSANRFVLRRMLDIETKCREFLAADGEPRSVPLPFLMGFAEKARARYPL